MFNSCISGQQLEFCVFECAIVELKKKVEKINKKLSDSDGYQPIETIKHRIKQPESIFKKMKLKQLPLTYNAIVENIHDVAGMRIICSFLEDIYRVFKEISEDEDLEIIKVKNYVKKPKPNGYRSLHLIVAMYVGFKEYRERILIEIQIRTLAMDFWATLEHKLIYKRFLSKNDKMVIDEINEYASIINELDNRMDRLKARCNKGDDSLETITSC